MVNPPAGWANTPARPAPTPSSSSTSSCHWPWWWGPAALLVDAIVNYVDPPRRRRAHRVGRAAEHAAAGVRLRRAPRRHPCHDPGAAPRRRAVPAGRHHRLDQGDRPRRRRGTTRGRGVRGVPQRDDRDRRARRHRARAVHLDAAAPPQGARARRGATAASDGEPRRLVPRRRTERGNPSRHGADRGPRATRSRCSCTARRTSRRLYDELCATGARRLDPLHRLARRSRRAAHRRPATAPSPGCSPGWPSAASTCAAWSGAPIPIRRTSASRRTSTWSRPSTRPAARCCSTSGSRAAGSHHQKLFVIRRAGRHDDDVAFVGGIDLCHGRRDDHRHVGDPQPIELEGDYGPHPAWHDVQLEVHGPAVGDLARTFRERWEDPTPLDHRNPLRRWLRRRGDASRRPPIRSRPRRPIRRPAGPHAVQVLRTYPARRPRVPVRARRRAQHRATPTSRPSGAPAGSSTSRTSTSGRRDAADALVDALERAPELRDRRRRAAAPRSRRCRLTGPPYRIAQNDAMERVARAGGDRVAGLRPRGRVRPPDLRARQGLRHRRRLDDRRFRQPQPPIVDQRLRAAAARCSTRPSTSASRPTRPGSVISARRLARDTRLRLWCEHLGRDDAEGRRRRPARPGRGNRGPASQRRTSSPTGTSKGRSGARPPGRVRIHRAEPVPQWAQVWARPLYRTLVDPDGRPWRLRRRGDLTDSDYSWTSSMRVPKLPFGCTNATVVPRLPGRGA